MPPRRYVSLIASVAHQTTGRCEFSKLEDRRYRVAERQRGELFGAAGEKGIRADRERAYAQSNQGSEDHLEVAFGAGMQDMGSQPERAGRRVHVSRLCLRNGRIGRIDQHGHGGRRRDHFMQQLQLLRPNLHAQHGYGRKVAARPVEAGDKLHLDRVDACQKDDRNRSGRRLCGQRRRSIRDDHGHLSANQIGRQHRESVVLILRETVFNDDVLALDIARFLEGVPATGGRISGQPSKNVRAAVTAGGFQAAVFFRKPDLALTATTTIPIVFLTSVDPVEMKLIASLNRPGGNLTGVTFLVATLAAKLLGLLRDLLPQAARIAVLTDPNMPVTESFVSDALAAAGAV